MHLTNLSSTVWSWEVVTDGPETSWYHWTQKHWVLQGLEALTLVIMCNSLTPADSRHLSVQYNTNPWNDTTESTSLIWFKYSLCLRGWCVSNTAVGLLLNIRWEIRVSHQQKKEMHTVNVLSRYRGHVASFIQFNSWLGIFSKLKQKLESSNETAAAAHWSVQGVQASHRCVSCLSAWKQSTLPVYVASLTP